MITNIVNLTDWNLVIVDDENKVLAQYPACDNIPLVKRWQQRVFVNNVFSPLIGYNWRVKNMPNPQTDTLYIVSPGVAFAMRSLSNRADLLTLDENGVVNRDYKSNTTYCLYLQVV